MIKDTIKNMLPERSLKFLRETRNSLKLMKKLEETKQKDRIFYLITPPPILKNIGDQAQAVAIQKWLRKHYPTKEIIEVNKNDLMYLMKIIKKYIKKEDIIFLHSGGNLGDRGKWSESRRRLIIQEFPENKIVSLPQTIYFSNTEIGQTEQKISEEIYNKHKDLTIIGRDFKSTEIAKEIFSNATVFECPDYVLSLGYQPKKEKTNNKILLCLRNDDESVLTQETKEKLIQSLNQKTTLYDTNVENDVKLSERDKLIEDTLEFFNDYSAVVTDRYHGLIFSVLCQKPTVVLKTVDHKLTSAIDWFKDIPNVVFADSIEDVPEKLKEVQNKQIENSIDFNYTYFDNIPKKI